MERHQLNEADFNLITAARNEFRTVLIKDWHGVAAAVRLRSGAVVAGLVLEAENPALTICAEPIVLGKCLDKLAEDPIELIVAVRAREGTEHKVIPPCGRCREFITDYAPESYVILYDEQEKQLVKVRASDLLPFKYKAIP